MKLYLLKGITPWRPWYDKMFGTVVRALDESNAREIASYMAMDEGSGVWLDETLTSCEELTTKGSQGVILTDVHST